MSALTPFSCSVHTHSALCDGKNTPREMAAAALAAGVRYFGFSGHSHTPVPADADCVLPADPAAYRDAVLSLRAQYAGSMEILLGIEQDSYTEQPVPDWCDYWIGSVHHLRDGESGKYYTVDWKPEILAQCCVEQFHGSFPALINRYYSEVAAMARRKPTILGHIDLIGKFNEDGDIFDENDRHYRAAALDALHAADPGATLLEINTGAMSRGYRSRPYPASFLLSEWRRMGGDVILTSDAHSAETVLYGYGEAAEAARAAGFRTCVLLTAAGRIACPL